MFVQWCVAAQRVARSQSQEIEYKIVICVKVTLLGGSPWYFSSVALNCLAQQPGIWAETTLLTLFFFLFFFCTNNKNYWPVMLPFPHTLPLNSYQPCLIDWPDWHLRIDLNMVESVKYSWFQNILMRNESKKCCTYLIDLRPRPIWSLIQSTLFK